MDSGAPLQIRSLSKTYTGHVDGAAALDGVDVSVEAGQTLAVLGPSGSGKSTLLRLIAGIEVPDSGEVVLGKAHLSGAGWALDPDRRGINMVFQSYALWPHMRVREIIGYGLTHGRHRTRRAAREAKIAELVALLRLDGLEDRHPAQLSGGQQQRVAIARALATAPGLLLFDEPLSNLDVQLRAAMRAELAGLFSSLDTTVVYVTHDATEALALADRILVLHEGRTVQHDTPRQVFTQPASPWVASMAGFGSQLTPTRVELAEPGVARAHVGGGSLVGRDCGPGAGTTPIVLVHPGAATITEPADDGLTGTVASCTYEGREYRVAVEVPGAGTVVVMSSQHYPTGATVGLHVTRDGVLVYGGEVEVAANLTAWLDGSEPVMHR